MNKRSKKRLNKGRMILMNIRNVPYHIEYNMIECDYADEVYKEFYEWIIKHYSKDNFDVIDKNLEFLIKAFDEVGKKLDYYSQNSENITKLMKLNQKNIKKFSEFINDTKEEYVFLNDIEDYQKNYRHYNRIVSWYTMTPNTIDKVIDNLREKQDNYMKMDHNNYFDTDIKIKDKHELILTK